MLISKTAPNMMPTTATSPAPFEEPQHWFAIQTHAKHEKKIASELTLRGVTTFVPTVRETRRWSDRRKVIDVALFSCYAFVRATLCAKVYHSVLQVPGVFRWVSMHGEPCCIPDEQIDAVRQIINGPVGCSPYPFLKAGSRVRIRGGCLTGLECVLVSDPGERKLVFCIDALQRSICITAEGYDLEPVSVSG